MNLSKYIRQLLFYNKFVVVPGFGAFIAAEQAACYREDDGVFYPPKKEIKFDEQIHQNDGLLVNLISKESGSSKEDVIDSVEDKVLEWKEFLEKDALVLQNIGTLKLDHEKGVLCFDPSTDNYLTTSFGLRSVRAKLIDRKLTVNSGTQIIAINQSNSVAKSTKHLSPLLRYAIALIMFYAFATSGWKTSSEYVENSSKTELDSTMEIPTKKISEASFLIKNPFQQKNKEKIASTEASKAEVSQKEIIENGEVASNEIIHHIIAGAFRSQKNAKKKQQQLLKKGYASEIVGTNKWNLIQVSFSSYSDKAEANAALRNIKRKGVRGAWILSE